MSKICRGLSRWCGWGAAIVLCTGLILLAGCGKAERGLSDAEREKLAKAEADRLFANIKPADPLPVDQMVSLLPQAPSGWTTTDPETKADKLGETRFSEASRGYSSADYTKTVTIRIRDTGGHIYSWATFTDDMPQEIPSSDKRGISVKEIDLDGLWAREMSYKKPPGCVIASMVGRFGVRIEALGLTSDEAKSIFWKAINIDALKKASGL